MSALSKPVHLKLTKPSEIKLAIIHRTSHGETYGFEVSIDPAGLDRYALLAEIEKAHKTLIDAFKPDYWKTPQP